MKIGEEGRVIRTAGKFAWLEPETVTLYWHDDGRTILRDSKGRLWPLEEGEFFLPDGNRFPDVAGAIAKEVA